MSMLLKVIYRFREIPFKIQVQFFRDKENLNLKYLWTQQNHKTQRRKTGGIKMPEFKVYYKVILIKTT